MSSACSSHGLGEGLPDGGVEQAHAVRDGLVEVHAALAERAGHGVHEGQRRPTAGRAAHGVLDHRRVVRQILQRRDDVRLPRRPTPDRGGRVRAQQQRAQPRRRSGGAAAAGPIPVYQRSCQPHRRAQVCAQSGTCGFRAAGRLVAGPARMTRGPACRVRGRGRVLVDIGPPGRESSMLRAAVRGSVGCDVT